MEKKASKIHPGRFRCLVDRSLKQLDFIRSFACRGSILGERRPLVNGFFTPGDDFYVSAREKYGGRSTSSRSESRLGGYPAELS